ncbi:MAG: SPOR domain-containing protein [Kiloniellaceae bacterium]
MLQTHGAKVPAGPKALACAVALLLPLLGGCDAIYDDTKGWANRLEASLLNSVRESDPQPEAPAAAETPALVATPAPPAIPAVPVEPVDSVSLAAPAEAPKDMREAEGPEPALAAAAELLLAGGETATAEAPEQVAAATPEAASAAAAPPKPQPKPEARAAGAQVDPAVAVVLHLSSLRSEDAAKRQWSDLQRSYPEPLGGMAAEFSRTELGDKGTFYRVLAGPLPSSDAARQVCDALKAKDARQYCRILPSPPKS